MTILETFDVVTVLSVFAFMMVMTGGALTLQAMAFRRENPRD